MHDQYTKQKIPTFFFIIKNDSSAAVDAADEKCAALFSRPHSLKLVEGKKKQK